MGTAAANSGEGKGKNKNKGSLVGKINSRGHYELIGDGVNFTEFRAKHPLESDHTDGSGGRHGRVAHEHAPKGRVKLIIEGPDGDYEEVGFYLSLGKWGDISEVEIPYEVTEVTNPGQFDLGANLWFDLNDDGDFALWEKVKGDTEKKTGPGGDDKVFIGTVTQGQSPLIIDTSNVTPPAGTTDDTLVGLWLGMLSPGNQDAEAIRKDVLVS